MSIKIKVSNYMCFGKEPIEVEFKEQFTAFIGPNNSGKSAMLKLIYEMSNLWELLTKQHTLLSYSPINFRRGSNFRDLFNDSNNGNMSIDITIPTDLESVNFYMSGVSLTIHKANIGEIEKHFYLNNKELILNNYISVLGNGTTRITIGNIQRTLNTNELVNNFINECSCLTKAMYFPPFRNAINKGTGEHYDISIGTEFISRWNSWKNGDNRENRQTITNVTNDIKEILGFKALEINANPSSDNFIVNVNGNSLLLDDMGAGVAQILLILVNAAIRKPSMIFIDEPETSFHPKLQVEFMNILKKYTEGKIVFATHSLGLARILAPESTFSFDLQQNGISKVSRIDSTRDYISFMNKMNYYVFNDFGFDKVLLIEGSTDVDMIKVFLGKLNKKYKFLVMSLGGGERINKNAGEHLHELKQRLSTNICCIIDSEKKSEIDKLQQERKDFQNICKKLDIPILVTERRALDNYLTESAIKNVLGDKYTTLSPYESLKERKQLGWRKSSNHKIAREMKWNDIKDTDLGEFLEKI